MTSSFQTFENRGGPEHTKERITLLREELKRRKLNGFIIARGDAHLNEYVSDRDERLLWLTGFSGSAGTAIILEHTAALFIDGRYELQVQSEVDNAVITPIPLMEQKPHQWLKDNATSALRLGSDPTLLSVNTYEKLTETLEAKAAKLVSCPINPIDTIWQDQPKAPEHPVVAHPKKYAGREPTDKIKQIQTILKEQSIDAFVATAPEDTCWLLNIRGQDVSHTPIMLAHAIIHARAKPELFLNTARLNARAKDHLTGNTRLQRPENFDDALKALGRQFKKVLIDPNRTNAAIYQVLRASRAEIVRGTSPVSLPKARKNKAEIEGSKTAHLRDGTAMVNFLHFLQEATKTSSLTEIDAAKALEQCRFDTGALKDISFETISGAGPNGAIVHYRVSEKTNRPLKNGELYLVDSGAQYKDGTTDITRTVAIGTPKPMMLRHYSLVLKAHIRLATACFPKGTRGADLDPIARAPLWQAGLDYNHGTGHGVGSFLSVHEGPQGISRRAMVPLEPGMILSNEPGYYREGAYGIRLENLVIIKDLEDIAGGEEPMMQFETLTLAPFDRTLIDPELLSKSELTWLNAYHKTVYKALNKTLKAPEKTWLKTATAPIEK